jgi:predicted O-methyltransferase YrrM
MKKVFPRDTVHVPVPPEAHSAATTFLVPGNQWYSAATIGASTIAPLVSRGPTARKVLELLDRLSRDEYMDFVRGYYRNALDQFGDDWTYADINTVLFGIASRVPIHDYMEIGVRRGRSMAMVAGHAPNARIVGFDMWIEGYAGMDNPGPDAVRTELAALGYHGDLRFVNGDSAKTVPEWFAAHPERWFDLITVDGDHSIEGARTDLTNVINRLRVGGMLVFDDMSNPSHPGLAQVWRETIGADARFSCWEFTELGFGVAFAIRQR